MPSSLMARAKSVAPQSSDARSTAITEKAADGRTKHVVTPPPHSADASVGAPTTTASLSTPSYSSLASRAGSSLAAAAAAAAAAASSSESGRGPTYSKRRNQTKSSPGYLPQFKQNPLNVAAAAASVASSSVSVDNAPSKTADEISNVTANSACTDEIISTQTGTTTSASYPTPPITKVPLLQQLLQHPKPPPPIPAPYAMCSKSEALDREQHLELSPLECHPSTIIKGGNVISIHGSGTKGGFNSSHDETRFSSNGNRASRTRPAHHPQYVIKKYRRSAAGGGTLSENSDRHPRTIDQLDMTVNYLLGWIFVHQIPPPTATAEATTFQGGDNCANVDPNEIPVWDDDDNTPVEHQQQQTHHEHAPYTLCETVSFIDDRLRAVQKDLVTLLGNLEDANNNHNIPQPQNTATKQRQMKRTVRDMQAKMVRYNILSSYLLSGLPPSKYEVKFGVRALRTSLTCYLNLSTTIHEEYSHGSGIDPNVDDQQQQKQQSQYEEEMSTQDEIMAYMALLHSSAVLRSEESALPPPTSSEVTSSLMEDSGSGWGALLSTFCKHVLNEQGNIKRGGDMIDKYPRWKWALELACCAQGGDYQRYFNLLEDGPNYQSTNTTSHSLKARGANNARFHILARCCASHSLNLVRLAQLRRYNHAFGKGEKVPATDVARLLRFGTEGEGPSSAIGFCRDAGLPVVIEKDAETGCNNASSFVVMKSGPISVRGDDAIRRMCIPGRLNDVFVFGSRFEHDNHDLQILAKEEKCDIGESVDDWEDRDLNDGEVLELVTRKIMPRIDEDGVSIPLSDLIGSLMN